MHILDEFHNHDVVIKRLKRIKEDRTKVEQTRLNDPFKKTFMEKTRDELGVGIEGGRQHWIRAKLHWFATSDLRREEITEEINKSFKLSRNMAMTTNDMQGIDYAVEVLDPSYKYTKTGEYSDEYLSLLKDKETRDRMKLSGEYQKIEYQRIEQHNNDLDFSVSGSHPVIRIEETQEASEIKRIGMDNRSKVNPEMKKSTTELFLSVHNYVQEKNSGEIEKPAAAAADFAATKLWAQSEEYMPGEKWDPQESFAAIPEPRLENPKRDEQAGFMDDASRMIGMLLAKADPAMFAAEAI